MFCFFEIYKMDRGLWSLWAKGCAVDNGFIVIHGKRPGSPQANCPQIHRPLVSVRQLAVPWGYQARPQARSVAPISH
jgi:hypothetical protein